MTTPTPTVTIIIVAYRTKELILRCLAYLPAGHKVIVVDNASDDGTATAIEATHPHIDVIRSPVNLGFGPAVNLAARQAHTPYLLLLNPDTQPVGDPVAALLAAARAYPGAGIYSGRTLRTNGTDDGGSCFALPSLWGYVCFAFGLSSLFRRSAWFNPEQLPRLDRTRGGPVPAVSGCVMLIERKLFVELDGFDPRFFLYSEDVDFCYRATRAGRWPLLVADATVIHLGGASSISTNKKVMVLRGKVTYIQRHWSPWRAQLARGLLTLGVWVRAQASRDWAVVWRRRVEWQAGW